MLTLLHKWDKFPTSMDMVAKYLFAHFDAQTTEKLCLLFDMLESNKEGDTNHSRWETDSSWIVHANDVAEIEWPGEKRQKRKHLAAEQQPQQGEQGDHDDKRTKAKRWDTFSKFLSRVGFQKSSPKKSLAWVCTWQDSRGIFWRSRILFAHHPLPPPNHTLPPPPTSSTGPSTPSSNNNTPISPLSPITVHLSPHPHAHPPSPPNPPIITPPNPPITYHLPPATPSAPSRSSEALFALFNSNGALHHFISVDDFPERPPMNFFVDPATVSNSTSLNNSLTNSTTSNNSLTNSTTLNSSLTNTIINTIANNTITNTRTEAEAHPAHTSSHPPLSQPPDSPLTAESLTMLAPLMNSAEKSAPNYPPTTSLSSYLRDVSGTLPFALALSDTLPNCCLQNLLMSTMTIEGLPMQ